MNRNNADGTMEIRKVGAVDEVKWSNCQPRCCSAQPINVDQETHSQSLISQVEGLLHRLTGMVEYLIAFIAWHGLAFNRKRCIFRAFRCIRVVLTRRSQRPFSSGAPLRYGLNGLVSTSS